MNEIDAILRGDRDARERWTAAWWPRVYRMALAMTGREADAEDLAQETLWAALDALPRFRGESQESTWLYAILRRKFRGRRATPVPPSPPSSRPVEVDGALALLSGLPPDQRITAALFYVEEMTIEEIAVALGVPAATVRWRLFRAREKLRRAAEGSALRRELS